MPGIPDSIGDNGWNVWLLKFMKAVDIEVDDRDIEGCHRINKLKGNSKKTIVRFCKLEFSKRVFYNKKKLAPVNKSVVGK